MNKLTVTICVVSCLLAGLLAGLLLGARDQGRVSRFNMNLLENCATSTCFSRSVAEHPLAELLVIWEGLACAQRQLHDAAQMESNLFKSGETFGGMELHAQRLAPVAAGFLQSRGVSCVEYFRLQSALAIRLRTATNDARFLPFLFGSEDIRTLTLATLGNFGVEESPNIPDYEWEAMREPIATFIASKYAFIREIDRQFLWHLVGYSERLRVSRAAKF